MDRHLNTEIIKEKIRTKENVISLRPNIPADHLSFFYDYLQKTKVNNKLFIASSGTTSKGQTKIFEISHDMMMGHAREICHIFNLNSQILYLNTLPLYYMGGISVVYRELACGFRTQTLKDWSASCFIDQAAKYSRKGLKVWSSLVPTQLFDIYHYGLNLQDFSGVFIGGDRLSSKLRDDILSSGDSVFETYGASEFCSQIATSKVRSNQGIELLPFVRLSQSCDESHSKKLPQTYIKTPFHYDAIHIIDSEGLASKTYNDHLVDGEHPLSDHLKINDSRIIIEGRRDDFIKINSQFVSLLAIENKLLEHIIQEPNCLQETDFFITSIRHERKGNEVAIVSKKPKIKLSKTLKSKLKELYISNFIYTKDFQYNTSGKLMRDSDLYLTGSLL